MTTKEKLTAIKTALSTYVPPAILAAGLPAFDLFDIGVTTDSQDRVITNYVNMASNSTDQESFKVIIRVQLTSDISEDIGEEIDYHDVIYPIIKEKITGPLLGMVERDSITADPWPANEQGGNAYIDYDLTFIDYLDKCDQ